jgi:hypothetical protein
MLSLLLAQVVGAFLAIALDQDPASIKEMAAKSQMVLRGTVKVMNSTTVTADDTSNLAVVRLDELVSGPPMMKAYVGKDITVRLVSKDVKEGEERVFFANSWIFGDSVGVAEVSSFRQGATAAAPGAQSLAQSVSEGRAAAVDQQLRARLDRADLVVVGKVVAVRTTPRTRVTEHDPEWSEADIDVGTVLKGNAQGRVTIAYPASNDVMWYKTPKPKEGQDGVFLLNGGVQGVAAGRFAVVEPQAILPVAETSRIRTLLGR